MSQEPELLEIGELAPHGRGGDAEPGALDEGARADRLAGRHVLLYHPPQDLPFAGAELVTRHFSDGSPDSRRVRAHQLTSSAVTAPPRNRPRVVSRSSSPQPF